MITIHRPNAKTKANTKNNLTMKYGVFPVVRFPIVQLPEFLPNWPIMASGGM